MVIYLGLVSGKIWAHTACSFQIRNSQQCANLGIPFLGNCRKCVSFYFQIVGRKKHMNKKGIQFFRDYYKIFRTWLIIQAGSYVFALLNLFQQSGARDEKRYIYVGNISLHGKITYILCSFTKILIQKILFSESLVSCLSRL